jgi:hypothetical protein
MAICIFVGWDTCGSYLICDALIYSLLQQYIYYSYISKQGQCMIVFKLICTSPYFKYEVPVA